MTNTRDAGGRPIEVHWFLPTSGDGRSVVDFFPDPDGRLPSSARRARIDYLRQIAQAADRLGFEGVLTPTGIQCEDAWLASAALAGATERLRFIVAFRPGLILPTLAAQQAATLQRISGGRTIINIVTGGDAAEQKTYGDFLEHDERYERTGEFIDVMRRCWGPALFDFEGTHYRVRKGGLRPPVGEVATEASLAGSATEPPVYFGGASPAAEKIAAKYVDVYLLWGEPPEWVKERVERMRGLAAEQGRTLRFGIRLHVIARETESEAWAAAERLLSTMTEEQVEVARRRFSRSESVGQQRMTQLAGDKLDMEALTVAPNLWSGIGLVRGGAGTALVGSYDQVTERIREYAALGLDTFIFSGYPHLEEAYVVGEEILPRVRGIRVGA